MLVRLKNVTVNVSGRATITRDSVWIDTNFITEVIPNNNESTEIGLASGTRIVVPGPAEAFLKNTLKVKS